MNLCAVWRELVSRPTTGSYFSAYPGPSFWGYLTGGIHFNILFYFIEREAIMRSASQFQLRLQAFWTIWRRAHLFTTRKKVELFIHYFASVHSKRYFSGISLLLIGNGISLEHSTTCFNFGTFIRASNETILTPKPCRKRLQDGF